MLFFFSFEFIKIRIGILYYSVNKYVFFSLCVRLCEGVGDVLSKRQEIFFRKIEAKSVRGIEAGKFKEL